MVEIKFQIGKNGVNDNVISSLLNAFKNHKQVRIGTLPASGRNKGSMKMLADTIVKGLESKEENRYYDYNIIGFTIIMRKHIKKTILARKQIKK